MTRGSILAVTGVTLLSAAIDVNVFRIAKVKAAGIKFLTTRAPFTIGTSVIVWKSVRDRAMKLEYVGKKLPHVKEHWPPRDTWRQDPSRSHSAEQAVS
jgi:hypothetical protein